MGRPRDAGAFADLGSGDRVDYARVMARGLVRRATRDKGGNFGRGGKWIRTAKRKRIYERDGWRCVWCLCDVRSGDATNTACLDHVLPRASGGSNHESNLVTACFSCNAERGDLSAIEFAFDEHGPRLAHVVLDRVITAMGKILPPART
jgi:5-methylcytosine-specific restriction endonuclease McrA